MNAETLVFDNGEVRLATYHVRELRKDEVLVQAEYTCISPGTELRCLRGGQTETPNEPYIPGYAMVGSLIQSRSPDFAEGERVYCSGTEDAGELDLQWGGHCQVAITGADKCLKVPTEVDSTAASLAALGGIAYHGFLQSKPESGEKVVVIGLGVLGQLSARMHAEAGAEVVACDLSPSRVAISNDAGIKAVMANEGLEPALRPFVPEGAALIVDCTGVPEVIPEAISLVQDIPWDDSPEPDVRYLIQGSYGGDVVIPYRDAFTKQLRFLFPRNCQKQDRQAFLQMLAAGDLHANDLIQHIYSPEEAVAAYVSLQNPAKTPGTVVFDWRK